MEQISVLPAETIVRRYLVGQLKPIEDVPFTLDEDEVCDILTAMMRGEAPPFVFTATPTGAGLIDGIMRLKILVGAFVPAEELRQQMDLPEFFDRLHVAGLNTRTDPLVIAQHGGPGWMPLSAAADTMLWLAWRDRVEKSDAFAPGTREAIFSGAGRAARALLDTRVVLIQTGAGVDWRQMRKALNSKLGRA